MPLTPIELDRLATRYLARNAYHAKVLDPIDWEFIDENPERAHEVAEFCDWLIWEEAPCSR